LLCYCLAQHVLCCCCCCGGGRVGNGDILPLLLRTEKGVAAQVQCVDSKGRSALYLAVLFGHHATVRQLFELGGNLEWRDINGLSPLTVAAFIGDVPMCELLLSLGAKCVSFVSQVHGCGVRVWVVLEVWMVV
jgi:ankyrin repeat protein